LVLGVASTCVLALIRLVNNLRRLVTKLLLRCDGAWYAGVRLAANSLRAALRVGRLTLHAGLLTWGVCTHGWRCGGCSENMEP
jgi:hypothetical protein